MYIFVWVCVCMYVHVYERMCVCVCAGARSASAVEYVCIAVDPTTARTSNVYAHAMAKVKSVHQNRRK